MHRGRFRTLQGADDDDGLSRDAGGGLVSFLGSQSRSKLVPKGPLSAKVDGCGAAAVVRVLPGGRAEILRLGAPLQSSSLS